MSHQIIRQPDGLLAVFSDNVDAFVVTDATPEELVEWYAQEAAERAREAARRQIDLVLNSPKPYAQFTLTWKEASALDRQHGSQ